MGYEYDADTGLNYAQARYQNPSLGRFISQDQAFLSVGDNNQIKQITGHELQQYLSDPQNLNSYSYVKNNPLIVIDRNGKWIAYLLGEKNAVALGNWANGNAVAQYATAHPVISVGAITIGAGAIAVGGVYAAGGSIACGNLCPAAASIIDSIGNYFSSQTDKAAKALNNTSFRDLQVVPSAHQKLDALSQKFGFSANDILSQASKSAQKFVDNANNGNINTWIPRPDGGQGLIRVTTNPEMNRIISAGLNTIENVKNGIVNGRFTPLKQ
ncbi:TPA: hypothetical protein DEB72_00540 [Patescibacteria group bacterium]|nr:hypothetical protein [Patescibacteria group bacterium]